MIKFSTLDWSKTLSAVQNIQGEVRTIGVDFYNNDNGEFNEIKKLWNDAGYTPNKVEWINFYPNTHFDDVSQQFAQEVNLTHIRSWISCIRPGKSAPWHQDVDDNMLEYIKLGELVRYTCHIATPAHGQVMMIEKNCYYMIPQGTLTKWDNFDDWHGASNCGFENHYLYHFLGYK